jgi:predicted AAA+ superfamily ATPase
VFLFRGTTSRIIMKKRLLFEKLVDHLAKKQISLIVGPRQSGKTTLMGQVYDYLTERGDRAFFISLEDPTILDLLDLHPEKLFEVIPPLNENVRNYILIDEVQYLSNPSNFLKYHYDHYQDKLKFIVSGSSSFYIDRKFTDALTGRKRLFRLLTLSFEEYLIFKDKTELVDYLNTGDIPQIYQNELLRMMMEYMTFGGYPEVIIEQDPEEKKAILSEIATTYVKKDAEEGNINYSGKYFDLLQILATQTGNMINMNQLGKTLQIDHNTVEKYITLMMKSFHISRVRPFFKNIPKEIRRTPKFYFNDLGLRNHFIRNYQPLALREDKGILFENLVFRRFLDRNDELEVQFWHTRNDQEVDFIIQKSRAYEVKYSEKHFSEKKYAYFREKYPEIPLSLIHFNNTLSIPMDKPLKFF